MFIRLYFFNILVFGEHLLLMSIRLTAPLSDDEIRHLLYFTKSSKDPAFQLIVNHQIQFGEIAGERSLTTSMMNMIYTGEMAPLIDGKEDPDWTAIKNIAKKYGNPGEEIYLRARTLFYYNHKDWNAYVPVAKLYLEKYGKFLNSRDYSLYEKMMNEHSGI